MSDLAGGFGPLELVLDAGGRIIGATPAAASSFGHPMADLLELGLAEVVATVGTVSDIPADLSALLGAIRAAAVTRFRRRDGTIFTGSAAVRELWLGAEERTLLSIVIRARPDISGHVNLLTRTPTADHHAVLGAVGLAMRVGEIRDPFTFVHGRKVGTLAALIAGRMGLDEIDQQALLVAGYLHDVGQLAVPADILAKPGRLNDAERLLVHDHPQVGYDVLHGLGLPGRAAEVALQHHERLDGSGYPNGIGAGDIVVEARIVAVADVVSAMCAHRPYRPALGVGLAMLEIDRGSGSVYDADVVDACRRVIIDDGYAPSD